MMLRNYFGGVSRRFARSMLASADGLVVVAAVRSSPSHGYLGQYFPLRRQVDWVTPERTPHLYINGVDHGQIDERCVVLASRDELRLAIGPTLLIDDARIPTSTGDLTFEVPRKVATRAEVLLLDIRPLRSGDKGPLVPAVVRVSARFGSNYTRLRRVQPATVAPAPVRPIDPLI